MEKHNTFKLNDVHRCEAMFFLPKIVLSLNLVGYMH